MPAPASNVVGFFHHWHWAPERRVRNQDSIARVHPAAAVLGAAAVLIFALAVRLDSSVRGMPPALVSSSDSRLAD